MSQKLCEECRKAANFSQPPWIHCHHEEEKKECGDCKNWKTYFDLSKADAKYCPKCGRRLW